MDEAKSSGSIDTDSSSSGKGSEALLNLGQVGLQTVLLGVNAAVGGLLFGYDTGSMSASLLQIKRPRGQAGGQCPGLSEEPLSVAQQEMVTSFVVLGAFASALCAGWLNERLGRRRVLLCGSLLFVVGAALMAAATNVAFMLVARIVVGFGVGISSHTVPLYISECAPAHLRGSLCFLNDMMIVVGQVTASVVSTALFYREVPDGWRLILGAAIVPSLMMFVGFFLQPESPRWLLMKGRADEAKDVLALLRGEGRDAVALEKELSQMIEGVKHELGLCGGSDLVPRSQTSSVINTYIRDPRTRRALLLGCGLQALQQWSGINTIMYYGATVLQRAGPAFDVRRTTCFTESNKNDVACTILFAAGQMAGVIASWFMVDRLGRRPLLLASLVGVSLSLTMTGIVFTQDVVSKVAVIFFVMLYLVTFGIGMSPVPWTVNAEIYPLPVRGQCLSLSTCTNWAMNFVVSQTFLSFAISLSTHTTNRREHPDGVFWLYGGISAVGLLVLWWSMPETKGLALEEISELFVSPDEYDRMKN